MFQYCVYAIGSRHKNEFVEIIVALECYLIMKQLFRICLPVKLADRRTSIKKEKVSSYIVYNFNSFSKMAGKTESFSGKIS